MGTAQIGSEDNRLTLGLTDTTIAALDDAFAACSREGTAFLLRLVEEGTLKITSRLIAPDTPAKFEYSLLEVDPDHRDLAASQLLANIHETGETTILVPTD